MCKANSHRILAVVIWVERLEILVLLEATASGPVDRPVIVAVVTVRVMQVAVHQVIDMIAVWDRFVAAVGAMHVRCIVCGALMRGTIAGIGCIHFQDMLVVMPLVWMVQVAVM
jgi:hypothetical protein